jgi:hypothetical protein
MADVTNNATINKSQGFGSTTFIMSVATGSNMTAVALEAQTEGYTVAGIEGTANGDMIALQGTGTPSITNAVLEATFEN